MNRQTAFAWIDMLHCLVVALFMMAVIAIADVKKDASESLVAGNVWIMATWPDESVADVDLWARGPGDRPVGYSAKNSTTLDLLRDDMGQVSDVTGQNYEVVISHGLIAGEYVVNLHLYRPDPELSVVPVVVTAQLLGPSAAPVILWREVVEISGTAEHTIMRFTLDASGHVIERNQIPVPLRTKGG